MKPAYKIDRRDFLKLTTLSSAYLVIGCYAPGSGKEAEIVNITKSDLGTEMNQYIFIDSSGRIILFNHRPEMGQGTFQSIPMILAEELEVNMDQVEIMQSPADSEKYGSQMVVGSRSIRSNYDLMRKMGASAREMLIRAATEKWKVSKEECYAENAVIYHKLSDRKLPYGDLVETAAKLKPVQDPPLKDPSEFKIIGKSFQRSDAEVKSNGEAEFGMDKKVPGMLYASVERSPVFVGKVVSFDDQKAREIPGVKHILKTKMHVWGKTREGVAVVADNYWAAYQARKALKIKWDNGDSEKFNNELLWKQYEKAAEKEDTVFVNNGNFQNSFDKSENKLEASYKTPYQVHAPMEPMNAIVSVEDGKCEFWGSTQNPNGVRSFLSRMLDIPEEKVRVNYTFMGGGFGRRSLTDVAEEAAWISREVGAPVKVIWSREDDITQGPFRACSLNVLKGGLDHSGKLNALEHKIICQDIRNQSPNSTKPGRSITGGVNTDYEIDNFKMSGVLMKSNIPITYWRSVYHSTNCFAHESFMDELAHKAGKDPVDFRLSMLKGHHRFTGVIKKVAEQSDWYSNKQGRGKGVAIVERSGSFIAMVVEVERINGKISPVKITAAIDCGITIHPDTVIAQTEGCIVMGLTSAYKSALHVKNGRIAENNFDTYKMLELHETPEIEVHIIDSMEEPEGVGEPGLPPVAPALTNAIYDLTGKRIRELPFNLGEV